MLDWLHPYRPYRQHFGIGRRYRIIGRFVPRMIQHYWFRPCRNELANLTSQEQERSLYNTLYDATFSLVLSGYKRLAQRDVRPETPQMLFLIRRWMRQIDLEFERQLASANRPALELINLAEDVQFARERALDFAGRTQCDRRIAATVDAFLNADFERYLKSIEQTMQQANVEEALEMVRQDPGVWLQAVIQCVRVYNDHPPNPRVDQNFLHLGIAGTLADDLLDVGHDLRAGDSNVLVAVLKNHGDEYQRMLDAGASVGAKGQRWWLRNCPESLFELFSYIEYHHCQIESPHLQSVTDLMLIPPMAGYDYKASIRKNT